MFAIAVSPIDDHVLVAGGGAGGIYRSSDGGTSWNAVLPGKTAVLTIAFSPFNPQVVLAGTRGGGAFISTDGGVKWNAAGGLDGRQVRAFAFAKSLVVAGTDKGVYSSDDGKAWASAGLTSTSIDAIAVAAVNPPVRLIAGGDSSGAGIPLYESIDAGATWNPLTPAISGTVVTKIAAGPLPPTGNIRAIVVGTNTGLFISTDNGATFTALSAGALLPSTDYTQIGFTSTHYDRFYVASDGGGESGGIWATGDAGQHFSSLQPPLPSVTALAVSADEQPILYVATFRPADHEVFIWSYHDTGGAPQQPVGGASTASGSGLHRVNAAESDLLKLLSAAQLPYIALGVLALGVLGWAVVSQFRSRRY